MNRGDIITIKHDNEYKDVTYIGNDPENINNIIVEIGHDRIFYDYEDDEDDEDCRAKKISIPKSTVIYNDNDNM